MCMQVLSASISDMDATDNTYNVKFYAGLITVFDPRLVASSLFMCFLVFNTQRISENKKSYTQMCVAKRLEANMHILSNPLIMSHRFTDALNGDTKWGQVTLLIYRSDFFQNGQLTHQSDGFLRSSKSHALIVFMFIWILSPLCDSLLLPHRAQELYTSWMTTVSHFYFLCCQCLLQSNSSTPSYK